MKIDENVFYLESEFDYKNVNCFVYFSSYGFRYGFIELDLKSLGISKDNLNNIIDKVHIIEYSKKSDSDGKWLVGFGLGHPNIIPDMSSFKKYFPKEFQENKDIKRKSMSLFRNEKDTFELCSNNCKKIVDKIFNLLIS